MPRIPRMLITGESTAYHVISRTALDGLPLEDSAHVLGQASYLLTNARNIDIPYPKIRNYSKNGRT